MNLILAAVMAFSFPAIGTKTLADCEDTGKAPCYTHDDGAWRVVRSYAPYASRVVKLCGTKKIVPPCLKKEDKRGERVYVFMGSI